MGMHICVFQASSKCSHTEEKNVHITFLHMELISILELYDADRS
jgi:hypothetical protein